MRMVVECNWYWMWFSCGLLLLAMSNLQFLIQSNLGSRTPRIMNNSVYEQIFRTQSVSDDYCVSSYEHASRQHRGAISWEYQLFSETEAQWV
jgi:hypothetical protein